MSKAYYNCWCYEWTIETNIWVGHDQAKAVELNCVCFNFKT